MQSVVKKALKIIMAKDNEGDSFVDSMRKVKAQLEPAEWEGLKPLTLFEILSSITVIDAVVMAEMNEALD